MRTIQREIVSGLIFSLDNKILFGKKDPRKGGVYSDCIHLPGGGIEQGEDLITGLMRELREEVGIDITPYTIELLDNADTGSAERTLDTGEKVIAEMHFNVYKITIPKNASDITVTLSSDLIDYLWVAPSDLQNYALTPPSLKLFTKLGYLS